MDPELLDMVLVPLGLAAMAVYHVCLLVTILRNPKRTVIGINAFARRRWVRAMMADPMKNGILAVQTLRNNIMASTVLATTAITLTSLISAFASLTSSSTTTTTTTSSSGLLFSGNRSSASISSLKYFTISLCFFLAFLCHLQSIRYYAHVSFLVTVASPVSGGGGGVSAAYVARSLNRGSCFWSLGLRAFYISFTLFLWIFGPIPMFGCCVVMCGMLYFLDFTTESTRIEYFLDSTTESTRVDLHESFNGEDNFAAIM